MGYGDSDYAKVPLQENAAVAPLAPSAVDDAKPATTAPASSSDPLGFYFAWGDDPRGDCTKVCEMSPCCGDPCSVPSGLYCCFNWFCCAPCSMGKLLATSAGVEECTVVNHCLPWHVFACIDNFAYPFGSIMSMGLLGVMRKNLRRRLNVGEPNMTLGDFVMHCLPCFAPCALCQEIRSVPIESWDWMSQVSQKGIKFIHEGPLLSAYTPQSSMTAPTPMVMTDAPTGMPAVPATYMAVPNTAPPMTFVAPGASVEMMPYPVMAPPPGAIPFVIGPNGVPVPYMMAAMPPPPPTSDESKE